MEEETDAKWRAAERAFRVLLSDEAKRKFYDGEYLRMKNLLAKEETVGETMGDN